MRYLFIVIVAATLLIFGLSWASVVLGLVLSAWICSAMGRHGGRHRRRW
jgi:hypothetical protein